MPIKQARRNVRSDVDALSSYFPNAGVGRADSASASVTNQVKVSSNDTTARYLLEKLAASNVVKLTELGDGGDESIRISIASGAAQYQYLVTGSSPYTPAWSTGYLNIAATKTLTVTTNLTNQDGAGILSWPVGGATLTIPETGTAALLATANVFTANQTISSAYTLYLRDTALKVYSSTDGQLDVDADVELEFTAPTIQINAATLFDVVGNTQIDGDLTFVGAQAIKTTASGDLTIQPNDDLVLDPDGNDVLLTSSVTISADNWVSGLTGWGVSYAGAGDFRSLTADELHVKAFIADIYQALVGGIIVSKSRGRLSRDFTIPSNGNTGTIYFEDLEGWSNTAIFATSDIIRLRHIDSSGGGLIVADVWGTVSAYSDLTGGEQSWTFTTADDGGVDGESIYEGTIALDYGQTGAGKIRGIWEATVLDTAGAPYSQIATWETDPWTPANWTAHVRLGNLDGIAGIDLQYGLWAGQNTTTKFLLLSDSSFEVHGLDIKMYDGASNTVRLDPATPSFAMGTNLPSAFGTNDGIWMGKDTVYKFRVGDVDGERLAWDGTDFYLYADNTNYLKATGNDLEFYSNGATTIVLDGATGDAIFGVVGAGKFNMMWDASEGDLLLRQNATAYFQVDGSASLLKFGQDVSAVATTAIAILGADQSYNGESLGAGDLLLGDNTASKANVLWDKSAGKMQFRGGTTMQCEIGTDGKFYADGGNIILDNSALTLKGVDWDEASLRFLNAWAQECRIFMDPVSTLRFFNLTPSSTPAVPAFEFNVYTGLAWQSLLHLAMDGGTIFGNSPLLTCGGLSTNIIATNGSIYLNDTSNTNITVGLTINQGTNDNQILALKSSDIAHGITDLAETDTYACFSKVDGNFGGLNLDVFTEDIYGFVMRCLVTNAITTKSTAGYSAINLRAAKKSGTGGGAMGADANLVSIDDNGTVRFIFDAEGSAHADVEWVTFDERDDTALLSNLESTMLAWQNPVKTQFVEFLQERQDEFEKLGIVHFDQDNPGHAMLNTTRLIMLMVGALTQLNGRLDKLEDNMAAMLPATQDITREDRDV